MRVSLLEWYSGVHEARGMPWRKPFDPSLGVDARAQRAYEVRRSYHNIPRFPAVLAAQLFEGLDLGDHASADASRHGDSLL
jgi:hypothetical protein